MSDSFRHYRCRSESRLLTSAFRHQAFLLSGLIQRQHVPDRLAWELVRILDATRSRALRQVERTMPRGRVLGSGSGVHPAIGEFLRRLGADDLTNNPHRSPDVLSGHPVCTE